MTMTSDRRLSLLCALPRHNDEHFDRKGYFAKIAAVAAEYTTEELREARQHCVDSRAHDRGVEFDDSRSRYMTGKDISSIGKAMGLHGAKDANEIPKATGAIDWKEVPYAGLDAPSLTCDIEGVHFDAFVVRPGFPRENYWEISRDGGKRAKVMDLPTFTTELKG